MQYAAVMGSQYSVVFASLAFASAVHLGNTHTHNTYIQLNVPSDHSSFEMVNNHIGKKRKSSGATRRAASCAFVRPS